MKFAYKCVAAWFEWANKNGRLGISQNDFFTIEFMTVEFFRRGILIIYDQFYFLPRRYSDF